MNLIRTLTEKVILCCIFTIFITACGDKKEFEVIPDQKKITGDLEEYLSIVEGSYKITQAERKMILTIKFKVLKALEKEKDLSEISSEVLDESGMPISGLERFQIKRGIWGHENELLKLGQVLRKGSGEVVIQLENNQITSKNESEILELLSDKAKKFNVNSVTEDVVEQVEVESNTNDLSEEVTSQDENSSSLFSDEGSENWDSMLNDYEAFVDDYISFYKKAMKGDLSAMAEYPGILAKAQALDESMKKAQSDNKLSVKQIGRLTKIQTKMLKAATGF